ncbi:DUF6477 family protein [Phaeobacter sp. B1627]|uniref:DUF6477 family protein n=1 Tax=Phaeobacter sp. B1627 TaxID=2583809 RepID=UPI002104BD1C|nr:DUF6477 family protein [Phaeobacter sp. B1627]
MQDLSSRIFTLRRPRLLSRAARIGADDYSRSRDLKRLMGATVPNRLSELLMRLLDLEAEQDGARRSNNPSYSLTRHVEILIAIAAESRLYLASKEAAPAPEKSPCAHLSSLSQIPDIK